jgi:hypothetical protein
MFSLYTSVGDQFTAITPETTLNTIRHCEKYYEQTLSGIPFTGRIFNSDHCNFSSFNKLI